MEKLSKFLILKHCKKSQLFFSAPCRSVSTSLFPYKFGNTDSNLLQTRSFIPKQEIIKLNEKILYNLNFDKGFKMAYIDLLKSAKDFDKQTLKSYCEGDLYKSMEKGLDEVKTDF